MSRETPANKITDSAQTIRFFPEAERFNYQPGIQTYYIQDGSKRQLPVVCEPGDLTFIEALNNTAIFVAESAPNASILIIDREGEIPAFTKLTDNKAFAYIQLPHPITTDTGETILETNLFIEINFTQTPNGQAQFKGISIADPDATTSAIESIPVAKYAETREIESDLQQSDAVINATSRGTQLGQSQLYYVELTDDELKLFKNSNIIVDTQPGREGIVPTGYLSVSRKLVSQKQLVEQIASGRTVNLVKDGLVSYLLSHISAVACFSPDQIPAIPGLQTETETTLDDYLLTTLESDNPSLSSHLEQLYEIKQKIMTSQVRQAIDSNQFNAILLTLPEWLKQSIGHVRDNSNIKSQSEAAINYLAAKASDHEKRRILLETFAFTHAHQALSEYLINTNQEELSKGNQEKLEILGIWRNYALNLNDVSEDVLTQAESSFSTEAWEAYQKAKKQEKNKSFR